MKRKLALLLGIAAGIGCVAQGYAQSIPAIGFGGHHINPSSDSGWVDTAGYIQCTNNCNLGMPNPDAATLQALQYADSNNLPGFLFNLNGQKYVQVCRLNEADPKSSPCMIYQANYSSSNPRAEPANWISEPGFNSYFVNYDLCINYYSPNGRDIGSSINWPQAQCGAYPYHFPGTKNGGDLNLPPGVPVYSPPPTNSCTGTHICPPTKEN